MMADPVLAAKARMEAFERRRDMALATVRRLELETAAAVREHQVYSDLAMETAATYRHAKSEAAIKEATYTHAKSEAAIKEAEGLAAATTASCDAEAGGSRNAEGEGA